MKALKRLLAITPMVIMVIIAFGYGLFVWLIVGDSNPDLPFEDTMEELLNWAGK